jgi:hypothetical protein
MGQGPITLTGRPQVLGVGAFGEALNLTRTVDPNSNGACAISLARISHRALGKGRPSVA